MIPIGVLFSRSGHYASLGREGFLGAMTAIAEINQNAIPFELVAQMRDPCGNVEAYAPLCRDIIESGGARFVVGCTTSWSRKEVIPVLEKTGAQLWYPCPYEGFEGNEQVVYVGACPNQHIVPLLAYVLPRFGDRPMLVGSNYIWGWETNRIAREIVERNGGSVLAERFVPLGDVDIGHIIDEVRHKRPSFVLNTLIGPSSAAFAEAYWQLGQDDPSFAAEQRPIISCNWTENEIGALHDKAVGHLTIAPYFQSLDTPANAAFLGTAWRLMPDLGRVSAFFVQAYAAVHMIARGIMAGGNDTSGVLDHAKRSAYAAPFGPLSIHAGTNHALLTPYIARARSDGAFDVLEHCEALTPDPYLVRSMPPPPTRARTHLRVVR